MRRRLFFVGLITALAVAFTLVVSGSAFAADKAADEAAAKAAAKKAALLKKYPDQPAPKDCLAQAKKEGKLHIYDWAEWWPEEIYTNFEKEFGIKIVRDNYSSADEMMTRFRLNPGVQYDIVNSGLADFFTLENLKVLKELNLNWVPNVKKYLPEQHKDLPLNPGCKYFAPSDFYLTGYAYNPKYVKTDDPLINSFKMLFETKKYKGRMTMLDDSYTTIGTALKYLGYSVNSDNEKELMEAKELLLKQKPDVVAYEAYPSRLLVEEEAVISHIWAGDAYFILGDLPDLKLILPEEGTLLGFGMLLIPKGGPHPAAAHLFINYMFRPEVHAMLMEAIGYTPCHTATPHFMSDKFKSWPSAFPTKEYLEKCELEEAKAVTGKGRKLRAQIWEELKR